MVDYALKPSLARYTFREEHEFVPAVSSAKDSDEALLAMVQQQADVAGSYLRNGDARKAVATLRRAYKVAADHGGADAQGVYVPAARRLALASLRLQLCAVLSRLGRHPQALIEARAAKHETDEVWRTALGGCAELVEASEEGNLNKPAAPLRRLLLRPPPWLPSVVEASIQARQCVALELEFVQDGLEGEEAAAPQPPPGLDGPDVTNLGTGEEASAGSEAHAEGPLEEEVQGMHREAVLLARQLLPEEHPVRDGAERAMLLRELRRQEAAERAERTQASSNSALAAAPRPRSSPMASAADMLLKRGRTRSVLPAALDATLGESTATKLLSALDGHMGFLNRRSSKVDMDLDAPVTHESLFSPPGDVFNRSFKRALLKEEKGTRPSGSSGAPGTMRARSDSLCSTGGKLKAGGAREKDPFRAWKLEVMDVNKMTMKEIKARSFDGIKELQADIKRDNRRFRSLWLKEMDQDLLYEDRTLYTDHGLRASEKAERKYEAWKKKAYKPSELTLQKKEEQKKVFSYYGVPMSASEPDLKAWGRVLRESHARTPAERERVRSELEEKRRREEEARRRREEEEKKAVEQKVAGLSLRRDSKA